MSETIATDEIRALVAEIDTLKRRLSEARRRAVPEVVTDLALRVADGSTWPLEAFFGHKNDLLVVHNMGRRCNYCTLWADGFAGLWHHIADRTAFVLASEDPPEVAAEFAHHRGWPFPVVSIHGTSFAKQLGVEYQPGHQEPGVSAFHRQPDGTIVRTGHSSFGPGDDFCAVWPFFDLLQGGASGWEPKFDYKPRGGCGAGCCCGH